MLIHSFTFSVDSIHLKKKLWPQQGKDHVVVGMTNQERFFGSAKKKAIGASFAKI
jgi:hypothetical protein